jgi:hypothetical protein
MSAIRGTADEADDMGLSSAFDPTETFGGEPSLDVAATSSAARRWS